MKFLIINKLCIRVSNLKKKKKKKKKKKIFYLKK